VDEVSSAYAEIGLAELAVRVSRDNEVKNVASLIKSEHSTLLKDLQHYASSKAISIPTEATDDAQLKVSELAKAKNFDKKWCAEVRMMHRQTIDEFELASSGVSDTALRKWVNKTLPSLRAHHDKIMACDERLK
jgi:putative membrane protein